MLKCTLSRGWRSATKHLRSLIARQRSVRKGRPAGECILEILEERSLLTGIWISTDELMQLPTSGPAWDTVLGAANTTSGLPDISNQDDKTDTNTLAKALVGVRLGDQNHLAQARANVMAAIGTEQGGRSLALSRNLAGYVISADLVGLDPDQDTQFRTWLRQLLTEVMSDGRSLTSTHEDRPNNWGTMAGSSRAVVAAYLGDQIEIARTAQVFKGWLGDRSSYADFKYGDLSWQADPTNPVGINPLGATKDGHSIDGALPEEMRRGGSFQWPPVETGYTWEALQGAVVQAEILSRAGYDTWEWQDQALLRSVQFLYSLGAGWEAVGDDEWTPWIIDAHYGTNFATNAQATAGKIMGWTAWTHEFPTVPPTPSLSIGGSTVTEGNSDTVNVVFSVSLSTASEQTVTVDFATTDGSAIAPTDYVAQSGTLTFAPGITSQTITVTVNSDVLDESSENFQVILSNPTNVIVANGSGLGTIYDNNPTPTLAIGDVTVSEGDSGTTNAVFTVSLSAVSGRTVTVSFATADSSAMAPADYAAQSGTLTFDPGVTTQTITVSVNGEMLDEGNENFLVDLTSPTNATLADGQGSGTILDDDDTLPTLSISDVTVVEGGSGTVNAVFTVSLSVASDQTVAVDFATVDGTAANPADYLAQSGTLTFEPGVTTQTITVAVNGDALDELDETFQVELINSTNANLADGQGVGTISNDDAPPALSISDATVIEGNSGTVNLVFTVSLSAVSDQPVTVNFAAANGSAAAPADYLAQSGTLTFQPGVTTQTITIAVNGDSLDEVDENLQVNLTSPTNATIADGQGTGTISDDDEAPSLSINDVSVVEGNGGTKSVTFTVTLSQASGKLVTVNFATADGTATSANSDYTANSGILSFAPGETTKTITIFILTDQTVEADETFVVNLSSAGNATVADAQGVCTIVNDDTPKKPRR